jgi:hypothetical protein
VRVNDFQWGQRPACACDRCGERGSVGVSSVVFFFQDVTATSQWGIIELPAFPVSNDEHKSKPNHKEKSEDGVLIEDDGNSPGIGHGGSDRS